MIATTTPEQTTSAGLTVPLFPDYVPTEEQEALKKLRDLAQDLEKAMDKTVEKYITLCEHIRVSQFMPKIIAKELGALGFPPSRISEIQRVALVSDEVWNQYRSRAIGFRVALQLAREEKTKEEERQAAEEAARNPELFAGQAAFPPSAAENPPAATEQPPEVKPEETPAPKKSSARSVEIDKTKTHQPVKAAPAPVESCWGVIHGPFGRSLPVFGKKLPTGWSPKMIFDVNGWRVEVRITRAKPTKKPAKKTTTKTKKGKK